MEAKIKNPKKKADCKNGVLSFRQIRNRVGDGWAIIKNPERDGAILLRGELIYHSSDRAEALEEFGKCKNGHFAFKFCGKPNPNAVYLL